MWEWHTILYNILYKYSLVGISIRFDSLVCFPLVDA